MVRAKLGHYYTFRIISQPNNTLVVECMKWEEFASQPGTTYKITPHLPGSHGGCSCPAWKDQCKHRKCVTEAMESGKIDELWKWRWDEKRGWQPIDDMKSLDEEENWD